MSGKRLLLYLIVGLLLIAGLLFYFLGTAAWRLWNIPVMLPSFADTRSILLGIQAWHLGYDPLFQNPLDPFGRPMAYPRLWLAFGALPLSESNTMPVALAQIGLFIAGLFLFIDHIDRRTALLTAAFVVSPAAMLCFERGNTDLLAFFLLACALALLSRSPLVSGLLIELAALLKLYPAIALGVLLRESKKTFTLGLALGLLVFGVYAAVTWRDIQQILFVAPKGVGFNYGVSVIGFWLLGLTASRPLANIILAIGFLLVYVLLVFALYMSNRDGSALTAQNPRALDAYRLGALIYIGTFLQGNTWNYRLVFLIFTLPQLTEWAANSPALPRRVAGLSLILLILSAWLPLFGAAEPPGASLWGTIQLLLDELANWGLLFGLSLLFFACLPDWVREQVALFFDKYRRLARLPA